MDKHIVFDCDGTLIDTSKLKYFLFPGIKELLHALSSDYKLSVWTARDRRSTLRILEELGVVHYFHAFCTIDDALPKPHISGILELVGDGAPTSVCVIGDTSNDILGAKNFGAKSIGAVWNKVTSTEGMKLLGADFVAEDPLSCLDWINKNL